MKKFIFFLQLLGIFILVFGLIYLVPNQINTTKLNRFLSAEFEPKKNNATEYLPLISSYTDVTFKKDPLFTLELNNDNNSIHISGFLVSSVNLKENVDAIYIFIHDAKYLGVTYNELSLTVEYDRVIGETSEGPVNHYAPSISAYKSALSGFYATEVVINNEVARITALNFGIMTSKNAYERNFLSVSNTFREGFVFSETLDNLNINLASNNLSSLIADSNNIPTDIERETHGIDYIPFNNKLLNSYYKQGWLWYPAYFLIISPIIYLVYIKPLLKIKGEHSKRKDQN